MPEVIAPDAAQAPEVSAEPQSAPPAESVTSAAAPDLADQAAQAPATEGVDAGSPTASDQRRPAKDRIEELVADKKALREAAEFWRDRALTAQTQPPAQPATPTADAAPTLEQFEFDTARWAAAHAEWADKQIELRTATAVDQRLQKREAEQAQAAVEQSWSQRVADLSKTDAGAVDSITIAGRIVSPLMGQLIKASEKGPQIAVHLGLNPDRAARIARLPEAQQAVQIGRLEAELSAPAPAKKPAPSTRAPAPPTPVGGNSPGKPIESMSIDEYMEARAARRNLTRA